MASAATAAAVSLRPPGYRLPGSTKSIANAGVFFRTVQLRPVKRFVGLQVRMDKRSNQLAEIRKMTKQEIEDKVLDLKGELFLMRAKKMLQRQDFKVFAYKNMKKHVARLLTVRREMELAEGISKRKSRNLRYRWQKDAPLRPPASLRPLIESFKERREQRMIKEREEKKMKREAKLERQAAEAAAKKEQKREQRLRYKARKAEKRMAQQQQQKEEQPV